MTSMLLGIGSMLGRICLNRSQHLRVLMCFLGVTWSSVLLADTHGPVEIYSDIGDLKVENRANVVHDRVILTLKNLEDTDIHCEVHFMNGPELMIKRVGFVSSGKEILFNAPLRRTVVKIVIDFSCQAI
ncbi:hypothetical protein [Hahella ganghwensis]|uniref:hypothetical protein n=1 Tax=Hahella ganghwensis TaxID=286420 RepID=UPI0003642734|nr:hypothetical protein [Hahella ganghwensis]